MENSEVNGYLTEEEVVELLTPLPIPAVFKKLFGEAEITELVEILTDDEVLDLDILHLTGEVPYEAIDEFQRSSERYAELCSKIDELVVRMLKEYMTEKRLKSWMNAVPVYKKYSPSGALKFEYGKGRLQDTPIAFYDLMNRLGLYLKVEKLPRSVSSQVRGQIANAFILNFITMLCEKVTFTLADFGCIGDADIFQCQEQLTCFMQTIERMQPVLAHTMIQAITVQNNLLPGAQYDNFKPLLEELKMEFENEPEIDFVEIQEEGMYKNVTSATRRFENGSIDMYMDPSLKDFTHVIAVAVFGYYDSANPTLVNVEGEMQSLVFKGTEVHNSIAFTVSRANGELYLQGSALPLNTLLEDEYYNALKSAIHSMIYENLCSQGSSLEPFDFEVQDTVRSDIGQVLESPKTLEAEVATYEYIPYTPKDEDVTEEAQKAENDQAHGTESVINSGRSFSVSSYRDLKRVKRVVESYCGKAARKGKHMVYKTSDGSTILLPNSAKGNKKDVSHGIVLGILKALNITLEEFAEHY